MRQGSVRRGGWAWALCVLMAQGALAQGSLGSQAARLWAWDQVKTWTFAKRDARGQTLWDNRTFLSLRYTDQTEQLLERLGGETRSRRVALMLLGERPLGQWAQAALDKPGDRDEVAQFLYAKGYRSPGQDPFLYLEPASRVDRPWTQGLALHLDGSDAWRFQWIPSPALLPGMKATMALPAALEQAPQPSVLVHLKHLRPGLLRLQALAGGSEGLVQALAHGSRAGFFLRPVETWLKRSSTALEPLASREAWILHYGVSRGERGPSEGTLVFLPGALPTRTTLTLTLLKLNPTSRGPRSRTLVWNGVYGGKASVTQVRGAGGVLTLCTTAEGTWISDREAPLRAVLFPLADVTLAERAEWCRVALAGMRTQTEVSLWLAPRLGAGAAFERAALRRRLLGSQQKSWNNPFIAKAAPRSGTLSMSLGAGPTELLLNAIFRKDQEAPLDDPQLPEISEGGQNLSPEQQQAYLAELQSVKSRREARQSLRNDSTALLTLLDLRGAALYWKGWVAPPPLSPAEKSALASFRKLQQESAHRASRLQGEGKLGFFGGHGEPGMTPSLALALPIQAGKAPALERSIKHLWSRLFKGQLENRVYAQGVLLHRVRTAQAFTPCYALVNDTLVLGSDDAAVQSVVSGLMGQATTLADLQSKAYGVAQIQGPSAAKDLETLLTAYLRVSQGGRAWWEGDPSPTDDEAAAEVAATFGPFLGAVKALGSRNLELEWTSAGLEARPQ